MLKMRGVLQKLSRTELIFFKQCSTVPRRKQELFYDSEVQNILKSLTGMNKEKVFRSRREGRTTERSLYQFVTDEELEKLQLEADRKAQQRLQMPPVMDERDPKGRVLETDPLLAGFDISKFVFTDITYGVSDRERIVVCRDPDGTLRTGDWEEQDRMNQIYYPREERKLRVPPMFEPANLQAILGPTKYEYILDKNCIQFEPDHPIYIRTAETVYNHLNENKHFSALHSTRHFGPFVFHICFSKQIDEFVIYQIMRSNLTNAANTIKVYQKVNQDLSFTVSGDDVETIKNFAKTSAKKKEKILMALEKV